MTDKAIAGSDSTKKLRLNFSLPRSNFLITLLNSFEILAYLGLFFSVLKGEFVNESLTNVVSFILLLLFLRIVKFTYFKQPLLPAVKFDLTFLTVITLLLVVIIVQNEGGSFASLRGGTFWSIGNIIIYSVFFYLSFLFFDRNWKIQLGLWSLLFFNAVFLITQSLEISFTAVYLRSLWDNPAFILSGILQFSLLAGSFTYFKGIPAKIILFILFLLLVPALVTFLASSYFLVLAISTFLGSVIYSVLKYKSFAELREQYSQDLENYKNAKISFREFLGQNLYIVLAIVSFISILTTVVLLAVDPNFARQISEQTGVFSNHFEGIEAKELFLGGGTKSPTNLLGLVSYYGLIGLGLILFLLYVLLKPILEFFRSKTSSYRSANFIFAMIFSLLVMFSGMIFSENSSQIVFQIAMLILIPYSLISVKKRAESSEAYLTPRKVNELFGIIRFILVVSLLVYLPLINEYILIILKS